jgi:hypothetical protein
MFCGGAMGLCRVLVMLGCLIVFVLGHWIFLQVDISDQLRVRFWRPFTNVSTSRWACGLSRLYFATSRVRAAIAPEKNLLLLLAWLGDGLVALILLRGRRGNAWSRSLRSFFGPSLRVVLWI